MILSNKMKTGILSNLKLLMEHRQLVIPLDQDLIGQVNGEQYEMSKMGELLFSHPNGSQINSGPSQWQRGALEFLIPLGNR